MCILNLTMYNVGNLVNRIVIIIRIDNKFRLLDSMIFNGEFFNLFLFMSFTIIIFVIKKCIYYLVFFLLMV